jgi:8-oxo-dGTP diphosphatase
VGALIERDGCFMITRRPATSRSWPGAWEFPGGKVEDGEDDASALRRELIEELGIEVEVEGLFMEVLDHDEGPRRLDLRIYHCQPGNEPAQTLGVDEIRWLRAEEMADLHFPTADRPVVAALIVHARDSRTAPAAEPGRISP